MVGLLPQKFCFSRVEIRPGNLHFKQVAKMPLVLGPILRTLLQHSTLILQMHKLRPREKYWNVETVSTLPVRWTAGTRKPMVKPMVPAFMCWLLAVSLEPCFAALPLLHLNITLIKRWGCCFCSWQQDKGLCLSAPSHAVSHSEQLQGLRKRKSSLEIPPYTNFSDRWTAEVAWSRNGLGCLLYNDFLETGFCFPPTEECGRRHVYIRETKWDWMTSNILSNFEILWSMKLALWIQIVKFPHFKPYYTSLWWYAICKWIMLSPENTCLHKLRISQVLFQQSIYKMRVLTLLSKDSHLTQSLSTLHSLNSLHCVLSVSQYLRSYCRLMTLLIVGSHPNKNREQSIMSLGHWYHQVAEKLLNI